MKRQHRVELLGTIISAWSYRHKIIDLTQAWTTWRLRMFSLRWVERTFKWRQRIVKSRATCSRYERTLVRLAWLRWCFTVSTWRASSHLHLKQRRQHMVQVKTLRVMEWSQRSQSRKLARVFYRWRLWCRPTSLQFRHLQSANAELSRAYSNMSGSHKTLLLKQQTHISQCKWWRLTMRLAACAHRVQLRQLWLRSVAQGWRVQIRVCWFAVLALPTMLWCGVKSAYLLITVIA